jgi:hypothetical protein
VCQVESRESRQKSKLCVRERKNGQATFVLCDNIEFDSISANVGIITGEST